MASLHMLEEHSNKRNKAGMVSVSAAANRLTQLT